VKNSNRIIFVPFINGFGGVERLVLALSHFLYKKNLAHTVVCFSQTINFSTYADWPMTVHELAPYRNSLSEAWALSRYMRFTHADDSPPPILFDLKGAFYAGFLPKIDYFVHMTDPPSLLPSEISKFAISLRREYSSLESISLNKLHLMIRGELVHSINKRGTANAISVIAMTNTIADELRMIYKVESKVIRPGTKKSKVLAVSPRYLNDNLRMLSVCRLEENKRLDWILSALADLEFSILPLSKKINWHLDLVGDGSIREKLQNLARDLGIEKRVRFHGKKSDLAVQDLFACAHLFLMPALQGYGLPALEALSSGVPVILHRDSGVSEILKGSPWVEICEDGKNSLATSINTMINRLCNDSFIKSDIPIFPSENDWAYAVSKHCRWL
jgi:glycosyltransferase involved in cell wall biosynthesis